MKWLEDLLRRRGVIDAEAVAEEIATEARKPGLSPWWNSRERWEHELGIKSKNDHRL